MVLVNRAIAVARPFSKVGLPKFSSFAFVVDFFLFLFLLLLFFGFFFLDLETLQCKQIKLFLVTHLFVVLLILILIYCSFICSSLNLLLHYLCLLTILAIKCFNIVLKERLCYGLNGAFWQLHNLSKKAFC